LLNLKEGEKYEKKIDLAQKHSPLLWRGGRGEGCSCRKNFPSPLKGEGATVAEERGIRVRERVDKTEKLSPRPQHYFSGRGKYFNKPRP